MATTISGNTSYRVNFAAAVLLRTQGRGPFTRNFDNCFEMGDGDEVARRLSNRAIKNPRLREAIERAMGPGWIEEYAGNDPRPIKTYG